jgi:hypothetical protein
MKFGGMSALDVPLKNNKPRAKRKVPGARMSDSLRRGAPRRRSHEACPTHLLSKPIEKYDHIKPRSENVQEPRMKRVHARAKTSTIFSGCHFPCATNKRISKYRPCPACLLCVCVCVCLGVDDV